jgi:LuxR family maltose regulon positive regulatory protein
MIMSGSHHKKGAEDAYLTKREVEILSLIVEGHASKQVADILFVSKRTVDFHLDNIYSKLNVTNRMQALNKAQRLGLLQIAA